MREVQLTDAKARRRLLLAWRGLRRDGMRSRMNRFAGVHKSDRGRQDRKETKNMDSVLKVAGYCSMAVCFLDQGAHRFADPIQVR